MEEDAAGVRRVAGKRGATQRRRCFEMKIQIKRVEAIKATRIHLDPDAGGA
jgi:hypothetical protein